jgi:hypothetical protein
MSKLITNNNFLYPTFLEDPKVYQQVEAYWKTQISELLAPQQIIPKSWLNKHYGNGEPIREGNPIYDTLLGNGKAGKKNSPPPNYKAKKSVPNNSERFYYFIN